jgi:tripartite-type tricarboxylate transporter receptor subunit TctC
VEIVEKLNSAVKASLAESVIRARFADLGAATIAGSPIEFGELIASETEKWAKVIRTAKIKVG